MLGKTKFGVGGGEKTLKRDMETVSSSSVGRLFQH